MLMLIINRIKGVPAIPIRRHFHPISFQNPAIHGIDRTVIVCAVFPLSMRFASFACNTPKAIKRIPKRTPLYFYKRVLSIQSFLSFFSLSFSAFSFFRSSILSIACFMASRFLSFSVVLSPTFLSTELENIFDSASE